jgi:hypothetical protein
MVTTVHQLYQSLYYPTNAHSVKNEQLLKHIKIKEAAPTCFGLQRNHHHAATASTLLKLQAWFIVDTDVVETLSVLWRHSMPPYKNLIHCILGKNIKYS